MKPITATLAPNDVVDAAHPFTLRLTGASASQTVRYSTEDRKAHHAAVTVSALLWYSGDDLRIIGVDRLWRVTRITDGLGREIAFPEVHHDATLSKGPPMVARNRDGFQTTDPFNATCAIEQEFGPIVRRVDLATVVHIADKVDPIDLPLPEKSYDAQQDAAVRGPAPKPITLWDGTTIQLVRYDKAHRRLEYELRTRDPAAFQHRWAPSAQAPVALALLHGHALGGGQKLGHNVIVSARDLQADASQPQTHTGKLLVYSLGPADGNTVDTMRLFLASNVRPIRLTASVSDIDLQAVLNVGVESKNEH